MFDFGFSQKSDRLFFTCSPEVVTGKIQRIVFSDNRVQLLPKIARSAPVSMESEDFVADR